MIHARQIATIEIEGFSIDIEDLELIVANNCISYSRRRKLCEMVNTRRERLIFVLLGTLTRI